MPTETFFQYLDASGAVHLVDRLDKVPEAFRGQAHKIELPVAEVAALKETLTGGQSIDPLSFGFGFAAAMALSALLWVVRGTAKLALKLAILVLLGILGTGLYLGYVRRSAGLSEQLLSDPKQLVDDAREAAERLDERRKATEKELP